MELKPKTVGSSQDEKLEGQPLIKPSSTNHDLHESIVDACRSVFDPEIPVDIYELGLIYDVMINEDRDVKILMTLTTPNCPVAESLPLDVENKVKSMEEVNDAEVEITFDPPWSQDLMSDEAKLEIGIL